MYHDFTVRLRARALSAEQRDDLQGRMHQALRWTYLGSGMVHSKFTATLAALSPAARDRVAAVARPSPDRPKE